MSIWNKQLDTITFKDIEDFCKEGHKEGVQLDYKDAMPNKGLSKHFASLSNTRGGLIILGVVEDRSTGLPVSYDGVTNSAKLVQQIHQQSTNVEPSTSYAIHATDEKNGKAFVLVRINEGITPPYYVKNDPNIWVRTGDINDPINIASPNAVRLMFDKKADAKLARENARKSADEDFGAILRRLDAERVATIAKAKSDFERQKNAAMESGNPLASRQTFTSHIYDKPLGSQSSNLTVSVLPQYPGAAITTPDKLKDELTEYRVQGRLYGEMPSLAGLEVLTNGIYSPKWVHGSGLYTSTQLYASGHVYDVHDVRHENGKTKELRLYQVAARIYMTLRCAANLYRRYGYNGGLELIVKLDDVQDCYIRDIGNPYFDPSDSGARQALLTDYEWRHSLDTRIFDDTADFMTFYNSVIKDVYWSLGNPDYTDAEIAQMFQEQGWSTS